VTAPDWKRVEHELDQLLPDNAGAKGLPPLQPSSGRFDEEKLLKHIADALQSELSREP
jgi:hypothetical protein